VLDENGMINTNESNVNVRALLGLQPADLLGWEKPSVTCCFTQQLKRFRKFQKVFENFEVVPPPGCGPVYCTKENKT